MVEEKRQKPQLTISLLASNRPDTIRRCLDSLRPLMERIPSELILVDTSKNPQVHEILLEYTNQVYEFEWCRDFSKARNVGLKKAKGEWFLFLDDDEWFVEIEELVHFFQSGEYKEYGYANYLVRNFYDPSYTYYSDSWVSRMIRIDEDTEFRSKIHEYMYPVRGKCKHISSIAYHSGYIYATEEQKRAHFERNSSLLLEMIKEEPENLRWQMQLVQEYRSVKEWETLCEYCKERIEATAHINEKYDNVHLGTFYAGYSEGLIFLKRYDEAEALCKAALEDKRSTQLCKALMHLHMGEICLKTEKYAEATSWIQMYLKEQEELGQDEELLTLQKMALLVNEVFDETNVKKAYSILICCDLKRGSTKLLKEYYDKLGWDSPVIYVFEGTEKYIVEAMAALPEEPIFLRMVKDAYGNTEFRRLMCEAAEEWKNKNESAFLRIMSVYAHADVDDWYIWYARILDAGSKTDMKSALEGFFVAIPNVLAIPEKIFELASGYGLDAEEEWKQVPADKWKANVEEYVFQADKERIELTQKHMNRVFPKEHWRYRYFELMLLEREVARGPKEPWNLLSHLTALQKFAEETMEFYGHYYKEEIFWTYPQALPTEVQAAIKIMEFLELEQKDSVSGLERLKEAALLCPYLAEGIKKFLLQYPELEKQRVKKQKEELRQLRNQVVEQVKQMLAKGQEEQALTVIAQLKQMVPDDLEVITLGLEARLATFEKTTRI